MGLSNFALDRFVSQQMASLSWTSRSIASEFPNYETWLDEFVLRRIFQNHVPDERAALALAMIRRAVGAIAEWELMCVVAKGNLRKPSTYFELLRHCEACMTASCQALNFGRRSLGTKLFEKGDASVFERLNVLYNESRHVDPDTLPSGTLHAVWLADQSLCSTRCSVTFDELEGVVTSLARTARTITAGPGSSKDEQTQPVEGHNT